MEEKGSRRKSLIVNIVLLAVLLVLIIVLVIAKFVLSPMKVSGESMMPTLRDGQLVLMHHTDNVTRGDIVVYEHGTRLVVKRLIGITGDRIEVRADGNVYRNGELLVEDYILDGRPIEEPYMRDVTLGEGEYFFLGDNRNNSNDSEDYGVVTRDKILGRLV